MKLSILDILLGLGRALLFYVLLFFLFLFGVVHHVDNIDLYEPVIVWMIFFLSNFFLIDVLFKDDLNNGTLAHLILNRKLLNQYLTKQILFSVFMSLIYVFFAIIITHFFVKFSPLMWLKYLSVLSITGLILLFSGLLIHLMVMSSKHPVLLYFVCYIPIMIPVFLFSLGVLYDEQLTLLTSQFYYLLSILCVVVLVCPFGIQKIILQLVKGRL